MLKAYAALSLIALLGAASRAQAQEGGWKVTTAKDAITDAAIVSATVTSKDGGIVVKCVTEGKRKTLSTLFVSREYLGSNGMVGAITYRMDDTDPVRTVWNPDLGGSTVWAERAKNTDPFLRRLLPSHKTVIRATKYTGENVTVEIDTSGAAEALRGPLESCGKSDLG